MYIRYTEERAEFYQPKQPNDNTGVSKHTRLNETKKKNYTHKKKKQQLNATHTHLHRPRRRRR